MIIEGDFYRLTPVNEYSINYDLELLYDIGGKNPRKEFKNVAYGIPLERAIKYIVSYSVRKNYSSEECVTLREYLNKYQKELHNIKELIQ